MRADNDWTPVLFVTARDDEVDRIIGLELGADDYVTKPFSPRELAARVTSVLRRTQGVPEATPAMVLGGVRLEPAQRRVFVDADTEVALTATEFDLLAYLMRRPGPGVQPRAAALGGLGLLVVGRHPHRRRAHRPAAGQARRGQSGAHGARGRLRRRSARTACSRAAHRSAGGAASLALRMSLLAAAAARDHRGRCRRPVDRHRAATSGQDGQRQLAQLADVTQTTADDGTTAASRSGPGGR